MLEISREKQNYHSEFISESDFGNFSDKFAQDSFANFSRIFGGKNA